MIWLIETLSNPNRLNRFRAPDSAHVSREKLTQEPSKMSASIHQEVDFKATPERVYQALTDAKQFSAFSGLTAEIHNEAGGAFKCFGGQIRGRMTELSPGKKIVQTWHVAMWPDGVESMVRIELRAQGEGTLLILDDSDFPEGNREHLDAGWPRMCWEPLRRHLA